jgi:predicted DNA-binding ribbon-helix-helix protein
MIVIAAMGSNAPRSVRISGRRTSMRLESQFWEALRDVAERERSDIGEICTRIAKRARNTNLSSAVRVAMMAYYRELAVGREPMKSFEAAD